MILKKEDSNMKVLINNIKIGKLAKLNSSNAEFEFIRKQDGGDNFMTIVPKNRKVIKELQILSKYKTPVEIKIIQDKTEYLNMLSLILGIYNCTSENIGELLIIMKKMRII